MRGLVVEGGRVALSTELEPERRRGECRVRVLRAGICATDLALVRGYMGFAGVPGHEFVGLALDGPHAGERVVGEINAGCGDCPSCREDSSRHCPTRTVLGILGRQGAFAEELSLPGRNLHRVPEELSTAEAIFAEPLAAAFRIAEQLGERRFPRALVVGDGKLGLLCTWTLAGHVGALDLAGRHPERADLAPAAVRWVDPVNPGRDWSQPYDLVVEATGRPEVLPPLFQAVRPRGTLVLKTTAELPVELDLAPLVVNEVELLGSRCGPFGPALEALAAHRIPVDRMLAESFPLQAGTEALEHAAQPGVLKVSFDFETP